MTDFQIPDKTPLTSVDRASDSLLIYDLSATSLKRATVNNLLDLTSHPVGVDDIQTVTNKTVGVSNTVTLLDTLFTLQDNSDNTKQAQFQLSAITTGTSRTYTLPDASSTLVDLLSTQTLTNKTLTAPTINNATIANPTLTVDTISEFTAANGVTVDGLNIKDGKLNTANSVIASNITNGIISNAMFSTTAGQPGGAWASWTPTLSGRFTDGDWTKTGRYLQIGKTVFYRLTLVATDATPMAGGTAEATFSLPVTAATYTSTANTSPIGQGTLFDAGTASIEAVVKVTDTTTVTIRAVLANGTYTDDTAITSTVPFTWTTSDEITISGFYEAA